MSDPIPAYDAAYNASIQVDWWTGSWRPTKFAYGEDPYGSGYFINSSFPIEIQANNAYCIAKYLLAQGWQFETLCGVFGNIESEGLFSPGKWENGHLLDLNYGFGLVQWTPATKYINWAAGIFDNTDPWYPLYYSGWYECYRLAMEGKYNLSTQWLQTSTYQFTIQNFVTGAALVGNTAHDRVEFAASAWLYDYERPGNYSSESTRRARAVAWYDRLQPLFPADAAKTTTRLKEPQVPGPYFGLTDIDTHLGAWIYKVLYMTSRRGSAYLWRNK